MWKNIQLKGPINECGENEGTLYLNILRIAEQKYAGDKITGERRRNYKRNSCNTVKGKRGTDNCADGRHRTHPMGSSNSNKATPSIFFMRSRQSTEGDE